MDGSGTVFPSHMKMHYDPFRADETRLPPRPNLAAAAETKSMHSAFGDLDSASQVTVRTPRSHVSVAGSQYGDSVSYFTGRSATTGISTKNKLGEVELQL